MVAGHVTLASLLLIAVGTASACSTNSNGGDAYVLRLDPTNGDVMWTYRTSGYTVDHPAAFENLVFVMGHKDLVALDADSGEERWARGGLQGTRAPALIEDGVVFAPSQPETPQGNIGHLVALDAGSGRELWSEGCLLGGYGSQVSVAGGGRAYLASSCEPGDGAASETHLVAFNPVDGSEIWRSEDVQYREGDADGGYAIGLGGSPVFESGYLVYANHDSRIRALDAATGDAAWEAPIASPPYSATVSAAAGTVFVWPQVDPLLIALDVETGGERWRFERVPGDYGALHFTLFNKPLVVDGVVYTFSSPSQMVALDLATGHEIWSTDGAAGTMASDGEVLYLGGHATIRAFDLDSGAPLWDRAYDLGEATRMQLNVVDGMLLATAPGESPPYRD
ncbi:MAG: PQQ-binding-like beta-propeller repeat protein [Dehalococcoidia bacterium]|nr:PQQ-binding-like beta-propeller repeat protein [Dehalococcoidia bacterium]